MNLNRRELLKTAALAPIASYLPASESSTPDDELLAVLVAPGRGMLDSRWELRSGTILEMGVDTMDKWEHPWWHSFGSKDVVLFAQERPIRLEGWFVSPLCVCSNPDLYWTPIRFYIRPHEQVWLRDTWLGLEQSKLCELRVVEIEIGYDPRPEIPRSGNRGADDAKPAERNVPGVSAPGQTGKDIGGQ